MATIEKSPAREVLNQPPPLEGYNVFESNLPLVEALRREGAEAFEDRVRLLGERAGTAESLERGRLANEHPPVLRTHDRYGNRIDEVEFHPAWHELLGLAIESGIHALPWREPVPGAQAGRAAMMLAMSGVESGTGCPLSMTYAGVPALRAQPELAEEWEPRLLSLEYDRRFIPAADKRGALMGMAMTERQGGSDVRRVHGPRAGRRRPVVLPAAALDPGRRAQPLPHPAAQGQARQPLERVERGRVRRRLGAARGRGGPRRARDHRDGQLHAPRLRARIDRSDAGGARAGDPP